MPWSYLNRDDFKDRNLANAAVADTTDNTKIDLVLQEVSRWMDEYCGRNFRVYSGAMYFFAEYGDLLQLDRDLISITSLKSDSNGSGTYDQTWTTTDYHLEPYNAAADEKPYTQIRTSPQSSRGFPAGVRKGIEITGKWGFWERLSSAGTLAEALDDSETAIDMTAGHSIKPLMTILVGAEQMFVSEVATNALAVQRGVNGTTAATALTGAAVSKYVYPDAVSGACYIQASRILTRRNAPWGVVGQGDMGQVQFIPRLDPDVRGFLEPLRRLWVGGF
jgi:hypothetical protein